jgi:PAS domain S-box-containing protein
VRLAGLAAAYAAAAVLLDLASGYFILGTGLAICYPPSGLYLAAVLLLGWRALPLAFLNPCFSLLVTLQDPRIGWGAVLSISAASLISPALLLAASSRLGFPRGRLDSFGGACAFVLTACLAVGVESLASACAYVATGLSVPAEFLTVAWGWWVSNVLPFLALTPVLLALFGRAPAAEDRPRLHRLLGIALVAALAPTSLWVAFAGPVEGNVLRLYLAFLPVLLGGLGFGIRGAALGGLLSTSSALVMAPYVLADAHVIMEAQAFLVVVNVAGLLTGAVMDERIRTVTALRESERLYRTLLDVTDTGYVMLNRGGLVVEANEEYLRLTGRPALEQILGQSVVMWTAPHDRDRNARAVRKCLETGRVRHLEIDYVRPDGSLQPIEINASVVGCGADMRILTLCRDTRERRRLEEQLRQSEKMQAIGQLAGGIAHDFNNQLTGVMGFADLLAGRLDDPQLRGFAEGILRAAGRAGDLTGQLLAFSRKGKFQSIPVDLHHAIGDVVGLLQHSVDKRIRIRTRLDAPAPVVTGDPGQIQNALLNLALNARDAMPEGGELAFETDGVVLDAEAGRLQSPEIPAGPYLRVVARDTGCGMSEETLTHLFEPFFTTKPVGKGTGMGLAAVYGTVRSHNGSIRVSSAPGHGTTVTILLPQAKGAPAVVASAPAAPLAKTSRIVIVDDEEICRTLATETLRAEGHRVTAFADGPEAVRHVRERGAETDLVILDLVMPGLSGRDTFRALREARPDLRVLLASGYSLDSEAQSLLDAGARGFVQKPFRLQDLLRAVAEALR